MSGWEGEEGEVEEEGWDHVVREDGEEGRR